MEAAGNHSGGIEPLTTRFSFSVAEKNSRRARSKLFNLLQYLCGYTNNAVYFFAKSSESTTSPQPSILSL